MSDFALFLLVFVVLLIMLAGLIGTIVPVLPGIELVWVGTLVYGLVGGFGQWGGWLFALITVLFVLGYGLQLVLTHAGALKTGASWQALLASLVLGTIGFFVIPVIGALIGALLGLFLVEYYRRKDPAQAWQATRGALVGYALGFGLQITFSLTIIALWVLWVWVG